MADTIKPGVVGHYEYKGDKEVFVVDNDENAEPEPEPKE